MMSQMINMANINKHKKGLNSDVNIEYISTGLADEIPKSSFHKRDFESYKIKKLLGI